MLMPIAAFVGPEAVSQLRQVQNDTGSPDGCASTPSPSRLPRLTLAAKVGGHVRACVRVFVRACVPTSVIALAARLTNSASCSMHAPHAAPPLDGITLTR
jgi:hypothetical protein